MAPPISLPIAPHSLALHDHLSALSLLSLQLSRLPSSPQPVRVPLTSKASFPGEVTKPNEVMVHLGRAGTGDHGEGDQWWVKMTAEEAAAYVQRRREALLLSHARAMDGLPPSLGDGEQFGMEKSSGGEKVLKLFHPVFHQPFVTESSNEASVAEAGTKTDKGKAEEKTVPIVKPDMGKHSVPDAPLPPTQDVLDMRIEQTASSSRNDSLIEIMTEGAASVRESTNVEESDTVYNEEGLPFHEIRETVDGETIGPLPPASTSGTIEPISEGKDDYWSEKSVKRRESLLRKIFLDGEDSDSEVEDLIEDVSPTEPSVNKVSSATSSTSSPSHPHGKNHVSPPTTHSILKHIPSQPTSISKPPLRKKSVSFDPSIPISPDSPAKPTAGGFGFPLPLAVEGEEEWKPKPVPVINEPKPKAKAGNSDFAGFKKGFLGASKVVASVPSLQTSSSSATASTNTAQVPDLPKPKKKSLFAQRLGSEEVDASAPPTSSSNPATLSAKSYVPRLPKMEESQGTSAMKGSVIEKPPTAASAGKVSEEPSAGSEIIEREIPTSSVSHASSAKASRDHVETDSQDDSLEEFSSGSEDEYDLDDALLAREVALEYHKRRAYMSMNRDPRDVPMGGENDYDQQQLHPGVMLGLPRIGEGDQGQGPVILNPTPDDLNRFLRVGRLENGNLVLAPGQTGMSDSEEDDERDGEDEENTKEIKERRMEVKRRRDDVRRKLMGLPVEERQEPLRKEEKEKEDERVRAMMPPTLRSDVTEAQPASTLASAPAPVSTKGNEPPPKKISRFKAARMGFSQ